MNIARIGIIGVALLLGVAAFFLMRSGANRPANLPVAQAQTEAPLRVLVAKRALRVGERLTPDAVMWAAWPKEGINPTFLEQTKAPKAADDVVDQIVRVEIAEGEPIVPTKIVKPGTGGVMSALITPGMRATALTINPKAGVAGFILPNDRVDVVMTRELTSESNGTQRADMRSEVILENVRVLAIDQMPYADPKVPTVVGSIATIEVSVEDSTRLETARKLGELSLILRSLPDSAGPTVARPGASVLTAPVSVSAKAAPAPGAPAPEANDNGTGVKVYRGGKQVAS